MIAIEIIMLIIGIAAVIASFRLSDEKETDNTKSNIDAEELEEKIKDAVKETEDYIITKADEKFSQISNDKIMGFNEYSKEVFDKIEKNHEETVFLYNMLTEKEKEIQKLVHSVDTTNAGLTQTLSGEITCDTECNPLHGPRVEEIIQKLEAGEDVDKQAFVDEVAFASDDTVTKVTIDGTDYDITPITQEIIDGRAY